LSGYLQRSVDPSTGLISGLTLSNNGDNQYGYDYSTNADTTMNILSANAHRRIALAAQLAGDQSSATAESNLGAALAGRVNQQLISPAGLYVDGLRADGSQSSHSSQLANASALAYGVCPQDRMGGVARYVASLNISVEPDRGMELLRGLHAAGRNDDVVRLLTDSSFPGWAAILKAGGTFTWETWTPSDLIGDSMSHGWGSSALVAMQEGLLGAVPITPGPGDPPTVVAVTPPAVTRLDRVTGSFPTPAGTYKVSWLRTGSGLHLDVGIPANAAARCTLPATSPVGVTESGRALSGAPGATVTSGTGSPLTVAVGAGAYQFFVPS